MLKKIIDFFTSKSRRKFENRTILFIENDEKDRTQIEKILTKRKFRVLLSPNGEGGLEIAQKEKPDLILMDVVLPGMSGIEVCKRLKGDELTKNIPVIFITKVDTTQNLIDCYEYGADDFLNKAVSPRTLISQIELTLEDYVPSASS